MKRSRFHFCYKACTQEMPRIYGNFNKLMNILSLFWFSFSPLKHKIALHKVLHHLIIHIMVAKFNCINQQHNILNVLGTPI